MILTTTTTTTLDSDNDLNFEISGGDVGIEGSAFDFTLTYGDDTAISSGFKKQHQGLQAPLPPMQFNIQLHFALQLQLTPRS